MSFPKALIPAAKSAYRATLRAGRLTFQNDPPRRQVWEQTLRQTFSSPTLTPPPTASNPAPTPATTPEEISARIDEWNEVAMFLRRNVVQGVLEDDTFKLRVTNDTELGDNASIREPAKLPTTPFPNRNRRRKSAEAEKTTP